jgi:hypothetical protein
LDVEVKRLGKTLNGQKTGQSLGMRNGNGDL